jgi:uncharacterized protein YbaR (Trm112 family)
MIDDQLLTLIQCPLSRQSLRIAPEALVTELNEKISRGELRDRSDQRVAEALDQGLITESGDRLYPVRGGIPTLIAEQSIELGQ